MASNSKKLGELFGGTDDVKEAVLDNVNPSFVSDKDNTSTGYFDLPNGTTAQRPTAASGMIRFNSTLGLAEYYDGTLWKAIDSPPTVTSISPETFSASGTTITITGQNFQSGVNVKLIDTDGTELTPDSVTLVSASSVTFDTTQAMVDNENDKFDVKVTNTSGLSGTLDNVLEISDGTISFNSSATSTLYDSGRSAGFDAGATTDGTESDLSFSYALTSGSLPSGGSLNSSTGSITGISAVGSDTVSNFTITATLTDASSGETTTGTRAFALTVKAPTVTSYTSTGSGTFSVPTGTTAVDVLVVAGGGGGAGEAGGGGGAGGLIYRPAFPVTPGGSVSYSVGAGGAFGNYPSDQGDRRGQDSTFGSLTAKGGGRASTGNQGPSDTLIDGGSGGGRHGNGGPYGRSNGTQPQQPGDSGTYGFGNQGGDNNGGLNPGGGGGGAGAQGTNNASTGSGGAGKQYSITGSQVWYAGGGGGGARGGNAGQGGQGGGGQGGGGPGTNGSGSSAGSAGQANTGGGGGGGTGGGSPLGGGGQGGAGGSGIVIVKY
mgnify:CR=1 FL=1